MSPRNDFYVAPLLCYCGLPRSRRREEDAKKRDRKSKKRVGGGKMEEIRVKKGPPLPPTLSPLGTAVTAQGRGGCKREEGRGTRRNGRSAKWFPKSAKVLLHMTFRFTHMRRHCGICSCSCCPPCRTSPPRSPPWRRPPPPGARGTPSRSPPPRLRAGRPRAG